MLEEILISIFVINCSIGIFTSGYIVGYSVKELIREIKGEDYGEKV